MINSPSGTSWSNYILVFVCPGYSYFLQKTGSSAVTSDIHCVLTGNNLSQDGHLDLASLVHYPWGDCLPKTLHSLLCLSVATCHLWGQAPLEEKWYNCIHI